MPARRQKILVDSTYLLPLVGVKVTGLPENPLGVMIGLDFEVKINEISMFEVFGKAVREAERAADRDIAMKRVEIGVKSLLLDMKIEKFPICEVETINNTLKLYECGLNDLPNCFITATAAIHTGLLLTESDDVKPAVQKADIPLEVLKWKDLTRIT